MTGGADSSEVDLLGESVAVGSAFRVLAVLLYSDSESVAIEELFFLLLA